MNESYSPTSVTPWSLLKVRQPSGHDRFVFPRACRGGFDPWWLMERWVILANTLIYG